MKRKINVIINHYIVELQSLLQQVALPTSPRVKRGGILKILIYLYFVSFTIYTLYIVWTLRREKTIAVLNTIYYWWVLVGLVFAIKAYRLNSDFLLKYSLILFLISVLIMLFSTIIISEFIASVSFVGFFVGIVLALFEAKRNSAHT